MKNETKNETLDMILIGGYIAIALTWGGMQINDIMRNRLEDKTAVAKSDAGNEEGTFIDHSRAYVAFDKDKDGRIDEIKEYRRGMVGGRCLASLPYTLRHHPMDLEFERIKKKYFSNIK